LTTTTTTITTTTNINNNNNNNNKVKHIDETNAPMLSSSIPCTEPRPQKKTHKTRNAVDGTKKKKTCQDTLTKHTKKAHLQILHNEIGGSMKQRKFQRSFTV